MHYYRKYDQFTNQADKDKQALADIKEWLGTRKFNQLEVQFQSCEPRFTFPQFTFACSMIGIEGYPTEAWARRLGIEVTQLNNEE